MSTLNVLVIDDEAALRQIVAATLVKAGYAVEQASCVTEGRVKLARGGVDVALCDIKMPDGTGIDLLRECKAMNLDTVFVMVTASASMETAVESLRGPVTRPPPHSTTMTGCGRTSAATKRGRASPGVSRWRPSRAAAQLIPSSARSTR